MSRTTAIVAAIVGIMIVSSFLRAERIQKWRTRDGKLYFGDRPPAGSTKIGEEGSDEPAVTEPPSNESSTAPSAESMKQSIDYSRKRTEIERQLNANADRLLDIDKRIAEVEHEPNFVLPWMEKRAGIQNQRAQSLQDLKSERASTLGTMVSLWKRFDELDGEVRKAYGGNAPIWWRSTLNCPKCPSRHEAESAL
jgi:hypothetical protein